MPLTLTLPHADATGGSRARFLETWLAGMAESDRRAMQGEIDKLG